MAVAIPKEIDFEDAAFLAVFGGDNEPDSEYDVTWKLAKIFLDINGL